MTRKTDDPERRLGSHQQVRVAAAGVADLEGLAAKTEEARELESRLQELDRDLESLRRQIGIVSQGQTHLTTVAQALALHDLAVSPGSAPAR